LDNAEVSDADKRVVLQLALQVAYLENSGQCRKNSSNPYAIQSRLCLLLYKLGVAVAYNCKSGKDRTGVNNLEINALAMETVLSGGLVPDPYAMTAERRERAAWLLNGTGCLEVSRDCTGVLGLKIVETGGFRFTPGRMGKWVAGASKHALE
jgi:phosphatidylinositol-4,5-bisphosphate 4-phosphatase